MKIKNGYVDTISPNPTRIHSNEINDLKNQLIVGRVTDIVLNEHHPKFKIVGEWNGIGTIFYEINNSIGSNVNTLTAKPIDPQSKTYPLVNELVVLLNLPNQNIGSDTSNTSYFYMNPINIWNHPHHDAYPNLLSSTLIPPSQQQDYNQTTGGSVRRVTDNSTEIDLNSPTNPSQNTFKEKTNIHPLMPFMGDVLYEGRHGQSLRLGSTAKTTSIYQNPWSEVGENGDPIIILRNGQSNKATDEGWIPINEDINNDLSSIYLTSTQKLKDLRVSSNLYNSYVSPPISVNQYTNPQIIFNSDRILLNSKTDSILLSSKKSIGFSSIESVNIDSKSIYADSNDIKLGSKNATEPVLKGDTTTELLLNLTNAIQQLAKILEVERNWPGGALQTGYNVVAGNVLGTLKEITSQLQSGELKSKTTKVQ